MSKYFFCYSKPLHKFIQNRYKLDYVTAALHETTLKKFWLYERSDQLRQAQEEYKTLFKSID
ncbi:hypothetical protein CYJ37_12055 [Bacillus sp. UMB0728]|nr:hypothetical protein CYJ37_12055 [Bacillus sp. UMB0728]